jgi:hypothetical protein
MVAPNPLYGLQMNLVAINISDPVQTHNIYYHRCFKQPVCRKFPLYILQMVAPNPLYGPQMKLVAINISDPALNTIKSPY